MVRNTGQVLTRRTLMAGGVGAVAASGLAFAELGPRRVLHQIGIVNSPDHHVPESGWPVEQFILDSAAMGGPIAWAIARPPSADVTGVVVCLHGRNDDHRFAFDTVPVHDVVAALGHSLAVVAVDGGADNYWHPRRSGVDPLKMVTASSPAV
ncbi:MAG: hypothetical protein JWR83_3106, partial [Aeromicrobium sp.]|nr:hypothetical protein [Aeromicrobium sp.]